MESFNIVSFAGKWYAVIGNDGSPFYLGPYKNIPDAEKSLKEFLALSSSKGA